MSFLTLAACRTALWNYASSVSYAARVTADETEVTNKINLACERLLTEINYRGSFSTARLRVYDEQITLPNPLDAIRSLRLVNSDGTLGASYEPQNQQANFTTGSYNMPDTYGDYGRAGVINEGVRDLGDGFPVFRDPTGTFYLRCKTDLTEPGTATILLRGLDADGEQVYQSNGTEGVSLAITTADTTTTQAFTALGSWVKSVATVGVIRLYAVDTTTAEEQLLVNITPGKLTSGYRRYSAKGFTFGQTVEALCNVNFLPAVADNDAILPGNLGAIKLALQSLQFEDKLDTDRADAAMARAVAILEKERDAFDGDSVSTVPFSGFNRINFFPA